MASSGDVNLPVLSQARPPGAGGGSRMERRRFAVLLVIQALMIVHVIQWLVMGRTISPIEPSESIETIERGVVNIGFIFFVIAIGSTMIFGRFFCGWGCHVILLQDWCGKLLGKAGIRPRPFRSRLLRWLPLGLACYMFLWPVAHRYLVAPWFGDVPPWPGWTVEVTTDDFWASFPGLLMAVPFLLICGFLTVYLLGMKGYCTYACPYGGVFAPVEQIAPVRIRVNDDCEHCGHCTAVCTSNVRVHEEVAAYGMVVDPGCMKCMDCVSTCPNDALSLGIGRPALAQELDPKTKVRHDLGWIEEVVFAVLALGFLLSVRGFYGLPLLFAGGVAVCATWLVWKSYRVVRDANVSFHRIPLKRAGRIVAGGWCLLGISATLIVAATWLSAVNVAGQIAAVRYRGVTMPVNLVFGQGTFIEPGPEMAAAAESAFDWYGRLDFVGDGGWSPIRPNRGRFEFIAIRRASCLSVLGRFEEAATVLGDAVERRGESEDLAIWQGMVFEVERPNEADAWYGAMLERHPEWFRLRDERVQWRLDEVSTASAIEEARVGVVAMPDTLLPLRRLAVLLGDSNEPVAWEESRRITQKTLEIEPDNPNAWRALALVEAKLGLLEDAEASISRGVELSPRNWRLLAEYALLLDDRGRRSEAETILERSIRNWIEAGGEAVGKRPSLPAQAVGPMLP